GLVAPVVDAVHRRLMGVGVLDGCEPHVRHVLARAPAIIFRAAEAHDGSTLRPDQIIGGPAYNPTDARGLGGDLIQGMDSRGSANFRNGFHVSLALEELHAEGEGPQPKEAFETTCQLAPCIRHGLPSLLRMARQVWSG